MLHFDFKRQNCSSTRCALGNASSRDSGVFGGKSVLINSFLDLDIFSRLIKTPKHIVHCTSLTNVSYKLWFLIQIEYL